MHAWVEDAQNLTELADLRTSEESLLIRTSDVSRFLENMRLSSAALVAPKGFGKTLILKLKRIVLQENGIGCLPRDIVVDRPIGQPPILSMDTANLLEVSGNWETIWQVAFSISLLKFYRSDAEVYKQIQELIVELETSNPIHDILQNGNIERPFEIVHSILSKTRPQIFAIVHAANQIIARYSRINRATAVFVDNIDEYIEGYTSTDRLPSAAFQSSHQRIWYNGQIGAWLALRRLNGINPRVKVFVSLRNEAFRYAAKTEAAFSNLRAYAHELRYTAADLANIILKNIGSEATRNLVDRNSDDPLVRFLGRDGTKIINAGTGQTETTRSYWLRHCVGRPRDVVAIGRHISSISPNQRTTTAIRRAINDAATERVQALFSEVRPFLMDFDPDILPHVIESNEIDKKSLGKAATKYKLAFIKKHGFGDLAARHPFCNLYSLGLIGVVSPDRLRPGYLIQKFADAGEIPLGEIAILPKADVYLIHPALADFLGSKDVRFFENLNRHNVVGNHLEWRHSQSIRFLIKCDVKDYRTKIMQSQSKAEAFQEYFQNMVESYTYDLDFREISGGDSLLIHDRSAVRLIRAWRNIAISLRESRFQMSLRAGGHSGPWKYSGFDSNGSIIPGVSELIGIAARLEPLARPDTLLVTASFLSNAEKSGTDISAFRFEEPSAVYFDKDVLVSGVGVRISKPTEKEEIVRCSFLNANPDADEDSN